MLMIIGRELKVYFYSTISHEIHDDAQDLKRRTSILLGESPSVAEVFLVPDEVPEGDDTAHALE